MKNGDTVWVLCAKVDPAAETWGHCKPAIDPRSFEWVRATATDITDEESVQIMWDDDKSITSYERRFVFTTEERDALGLRATI